MPSTLADRRRGRTAAVLLCLVLTAAADWLFFRRTIGWTAGLYGALLLAALLARSGRGSARLPAAVLGLGVLGLIAAMVEEPTVMAAALAVLGLVTLALVLRAGWTASVGAWLSRWGQFLVRCWVQVFVDSRLARRWRGRHQRLTPRGLVWRYWILPVLLTAMFAALFAVANPIIEEWLTALRRLCSDVLHNLRAYLPPSRFALWFIAGAGAWALLRLRPRHRRSAAPSVLPVGQPVPGELLMAEPVTWRNDPGWVVRSLWLFNAAFLVQTALDVYYLWGHAALPPAMTYAQYAHRGAYPLVATALLAAGFVLITFRPGGPGEHSRPARRLVYLWLAQNVFLVASAAWRLCLYVDAYSLTRFRVAAAIWMGLVALGLVWILWRIVAGRSNAWLLRVNFLTVVVTLYVCCFVNFDGWIASYNVRHCREITGDTGRAKLDVEYLAKLGPESLPALRWLEANAEDSRLRLLARREATTLQEELDRELADWRGWTWRRHRLAAEPPQTQLVREADDSIEPAAHR